MTEEIPQKGKINPLRCGCSVLLLPVLFFFAVSAVCVIVGFISERGHVEVVTGTVQDKYPKRFGIDQSDRYIIEFKKDNGDVEVFQDTDTVFWWKFNSADVYSHLEKGKKYEFTVVGWRIEFLSLFRNIVSYTGLSDQ